MSNFTKGNFIKSHLGNKELRSHIDAVHAFPPNDDINTGKIVEGVVQKINCYGIIATVSRKKADLNKSRNQRHHITQSQLSAECEYDQTIRKILEHLNILDGNEKLVRPYLRIAIHGMKDARYGKQAIEIGTQCGASCQSEVKDWFVKKIIQKSKKVFGRNLKIKVDNYFCGKTTSLGFHRQKYGENFNAFQIEISLSLRKNHLKKLIDIFSTTMAEFNKKF